MRKVIMAASGALVLAACGDGSGGGAGTVPVVSGAAAAVTPAPAPSPTATPTPTPVSSPVATPTPSTSYPRYADLTGDRSFQTACASLVLGGGLPVPQPAAPFGESLALATTAASGGWSVNGDGVALSFAGGEAVSAPAGQKIYERVVAGSTQRLTIAEPNASGSTPSYTRSLALRADRSAGTTMYSCVFGVPSLAADVPAATIGYGRVGVAGTAYMTDANGVVQAYVLSASTGTARYDANGKAIAFQVHLVGYLQTGTSLAATSTDLGTYSGSAAIDAARVRFAGSFDGGDRINLFSSFAGAFFGGVEAGAAFQILATDPKSGNRVAAVGTVVAAP